MPRSIPHPSKASKKKTGKIKIKKSIKLQKKGSEVNDTIRGSIPTPRDNGATFKVKIRRK